MILRVLLVTMITAVTVWGFQNCSSNLVFEDHSMDLALNHPPTDSSETLEGKVVVGDHQYLVSVFRDVLQSPTTTAEEYGALEYYMSYEFNPIRHLLGRSCNPHETGDLCAGEVPNTAIGMSGQSSSGREAGRVQVCRWMATNNSLIGRIRDKVKGNDPTPNMESAARMVELFYPALDGAVMIETASALMELDGEMTRANELVLDRWRLIFLNVCESPGWEAL